MTRRFRLPRYAVGLVAFPCAALVAAACGGTDYLDAPDAASLDGSITDAHGDTSLVDGQSADANGDADATSMDASTDTGPSDTGMLHDADAGLVDADAGLPDVGLPDADAGLRDAATDADAALLDAALDADAAIRDASDASDASSDSGTSSLFPNLLTMTPFAILGGTTITNSGVATIITGDIGTNGPSVTGLTGHPFQPSGTTELNTPRANQALLDVATTSTILAGRTCPLAHDLSGQDLGGKVLTPGVYCFSSSASQSTLTTLTFDAQGDPNAVWIIQVISTLTVMDNAVATIVGGPPSMACRVFWSIGSAATINAGALFVGNIFANASVSMLTGSSLSPGRAFGQTGGVSLLGDTVSAALCQ